jgi:hypothetical protein
VHVADAAALQAQSDLTIAYNDAAGRAPTASAAGDLAGLTFTPGVYNSTSSLALNGTVPLDVQGDPSARVHLPDRLPAQSSRAVLSRAPAR